MSIFSDYKVGALMECIAYNNRVRAEEEYDLDYDDLEGEEDG